MGRDTDAMKEYLRTAQLEGIPPAEIERLRRAYAATGMPGFWRVRLAIELRRAGSDPDPHRIASVAARSGDVEQTLYWLERACAERSMALAFLGVLPAFDGVREHPRVQAILRRMRLPAAVE